jgi:hypothetical protein
MRTILTAIVVLGIAGVATSAAEPQYNFSFTVQVDEAPPVALRVSVPPGTSHTLQATEHLRVEIDVPTSIGETSTTVVKLIDDSSGTPVVLHTARRVGPIAVVRSFGYTVCGGMATFQSPLEAKHIGCEKKAS